jgi:hypothetical protein
MPELPKVSRRLVTAQEPHSSVNGAAISAPFTMVARQFDLFGKSLAPPPPLRRGRVAVRSGSGAAKADPNPMTPEDADALESAVTTGKLARTEQEIVQDVGKIADETRGDPDQFRLAADSYRDRRAGNFAATHGEDFGEAVKRLVDVEADERLTGMRFDKARGDVRQATSDITVRLAALSDDMVDLAASEGTGTDAFKRRAAQFRDLITAATANPLIQFSPEDADLQFGDVEARTKLAAALAVTRNAWERGGADQAMAAADVVTESMGDATMRVRLDREIERLAAADEQVMLDAVRERGEYRDALRRIGFTAFASGAVDQTWLDRNESRLDARAFDLLSQAAVIAPPAVTDPVQRADLLHVAMLGIDLAAEPTLEAYAAGAVDRATLSTAFRLAAQVDADAEARPWANELRRSVARQLRIAERPGRSGALVELSDWLSTAQQATPEQARDAADVLVKQYEARDRAEMRAVLPTPRFAPQRSGLDHAGIAAAQQRVIAAAKQGRISLAEIAAESDLLDDWRDAVTRET